MAKQAQALSEEAERILVRELESQSDRGVAIVLSSYLDAKLQEVLERFFSCNLSTKQEDSIFRTPNAPLASFSARIRIAHALGLIGPKTEHDLHVIRALRNEFAHGLLILDFSNDEVIRKCKTLLLADMGLGSLRDTPLSDPRKRLVSAGINALHFLYGELRTRKVGASAPTVSP